MAHLTDGHSDRAQLLIVSAFALGVLFVALALILNSAIFTENLASRGETTGGDNVIAYQDGLQRGSGDILRYENENVTDGNPSYATLRSRIERGTANLSVVLTRRSAKAGATSSNRIENQSNGSLIRQTNNNRNFTDANATANWTLAADVTQTRALQLNITQSEIKSCNRFGDCFNLNVTNGTDDWTLSINNSSGITVAVEDQSGTTATCAPVDEPNVVVDVTAGTVGNTTCPALNFSDAPDTPYAIEYENGSQIGGMYSLVIDNTTIDSGLARYSPDPTTGKPSVTPAVYSITIDYDYQSAAVNYTSSVRVAPGESDG